MNNMSIRLEKLASSVEEEGLIDTKNGDAYVKIASAASALSVLQLPKVLALATAITAGSKISGAGIDAASGMVDSMKYNRKRDNEILPFAKKHNPSLKNVSDSKLSDWLDSAHAMAPKVAKNKMLATTYLGNVHAMGGQVDIQTANTLSTIGKNTSSGGSDVSGGMPSAAAMLGGM